MGFSRRVRVHALPLEANELVRLARGRITVLTRMQDSRSVKARTSVSPRAGLAGTTHGKAAVCHPS
jgi:hypothetical protein